MIDWGTQISHGLSAAHGRGVVHRDLKPENVFLLRDGRVKILDFGLAKLEAPFRAPGADAATVSVATSAGVTLGTVGYMAPEQVRGDSIGPAADIFALGALLYELVSGRPAFRHKTAVETLNAILNEDPAQLSSGSPAVERVILRCLEKDPENRFRSAADVAFALGAMSHEGTTTQPVPSVAAPFCVRESSPQPELFCYSGLPHGSHREEAANWCRRRRRPRWRPRG